MGYNLTAMSREQQKKILTDCYCQFLKTSGEKEPVNMPDFDKIEVLQDRQKKLFVVGTLRSENKQYKDSWGVEPHYAVSCITFGAEIIRDKTTKEEKLSGNAFKIFALSHDEARPTADWLVAHETLSDSDLKEKTAPYTFVIVKDYKNGRCTNSIGDRVKIRGFYDVRDRRKIIQALIKGKKIDLESKSTAERVLDTCKRFIHANDKDIQAAEQREQYLKDKATEARIENISNMKKAVNKVGGSTPKKRSRIKQTLHKARVRLAMSKGKKEEENLLLKQRRYDVNEAKEARAKRMAEKQH